MMMGGIEKMFRHMGWADRRVLGLIGDEWAVPAGAVRLFAHVLAAERVWLMRLRGEESDGQAIWPDLHEGELAELAAENREGYARLLGGMTESEMGRVVGYTNQRGETYRTSVEDILIHIAMHGSYHRGQIAAGVRGAGGKPVNTDYITFIREGDGGLP